MERGGRGPRWTTKRRVGVEESRSGGAELAAAGAVGGPVFAVQEGHGGR